MKVVQINRADIIGGRFNNYSLRDAWGNTGVQSSHLVWDKASDDERVRLLFPFRGSRFINRVLSRFERDLSMHSMLQLQSFVMPLHKQFREADVAHYHIIHDGFFSLMAMPLLSRLKPSVWTWHDPWPMTGHCVYPLGCQRWRTGCGACPDLSLFFAMKKDRTAQAFKAKRDIIKNSNVDIVVASDFMHDMARSSPMGRHARIHQIPFGIDLGLYKRRDHAESRRRFGIGENRVVIALRAISSPFKGLEYFVEAINEIETNVPITILSFQETGYFNNLLGKHQIVELGWVNDDDIIVDALSAADIFAMPSTAEAFGMMAIEAMACSLPVVVFEGTSLPQVIFAPKGGIAVPMRDAAALSRALKYLIENPEDRRLRGEEARRLAEQHYSLPLFVERLSKLYQDVARRGAPAMRGVVRANSAAH